MGRFKASYSPSQATIPKAPTIYICDPADNAAIACELAKLIPNTLHLSIKPLHGTKFANLLMAEDCSNPYEPDNQVCILTNNQADANEKAKRESADIYRERAIVRGCSFVSINISFDSTPRTVEWGANHLEVCANRSATKGSVEARKYAEQIYKWLFTVLDVKDTLHLISDEEMQVIDKGASFKDYTYCTIGDCNKVTKDAKVQFVTLIVTKPTIISSNRLAWQVADKTGVANFYFKWCGPSSQVTWDWVLRLEPGQRRCLPRMPCVLVKENILVSIAKAPIRIPGSAICLTGQAVKKLGIGINRLGKAMKMGRRSEWVRQEDVRDYLRAHRSSRICVVPSTEKATIQVFTDKGIKIWSDNDSSRSTLRSEENEGDMEKDLG